MNQITGQGWVDWAREQIRTASDQARDAVTESSQTIAVENRMHWMPYILMMRDASLKNFMVNIELLTEEDFDQSVACEGAKPFSWYEILAHANKAFSIDASNAAGFLPRAMEILKKEYAIESLPSQDSKESFRFEDVTYSMNDDSLPAASEMVHEFLASQDDPRRFCFLESSVVEEQPIVFGKPSSVDRLLNRLELGNALVMSVES